jgi:hypothetical protein
VKTTSETIYPDDCITPLMHHKPTPAMSKVLGRLRKLAKPMLNLKPKQRDDAVRRYLKKNGIRLATARAVIENLSEFLMVRDASNFLMRRDIPVKNSGRLTQAELDAKVVRLAAKHPEGETEKNYQARLSRGMFPPGEKLYRIPQTQLDALVAWKKRRKSTGGRRSAETLSNRAPQPRSASGTFLRR